MIELIMMMRPQGLRLEARVPTCPPLLLHHWVGRLKAMTNLPKLTFCLSF